MAKCMDHIKDLRNAKKLKYSYALYCFISDKDQDWSSNEYEHDDHNGHDFNRCSLFKNALFFQEC